MTEKTAGIKVMFDDSSPINYDRTHKEVLAVVRVL